MKKIILLAAVFLTTLAQAQTPQISAFNGSTEITEGYVYTTNSIGSTNHGELKIKVTNLSNATINLKLKITGLTNADNLSSDIEDPKLQFCFGDECHFSISVNGTVPSAPAGVAFAPGASNNDQDHFYSIYAGDNTALDVVYNLAIVQVDGEGTELATLRNFSYKYAPTAGLNDFASLKNMGITVNNTVVKNSLDLTANQNAKLELININGQTIKTANITGGSQSVDLSGVASAVYFARFTNENKQTSQIRIVKN